MTDVTTSTQTQDFNSTIAPLLDGLRGQAMRLCRDSADADDLVQETLARVWRFWDRFDGKRPKAWVYTIQKNTFINSYHRAGRRRRGSAELAAAVRDIDERSAVAGSLAAPAQPDEVIEQAEIQAAISRALSHLPDHYRDSVMLADFEGLSYREIAERTGVEIGTVMSRIYRGRRMVGQELGEDPR